MTGTISTLDFLYIVLAVGFIPFFTILCMILWRVYKMMDRIESVLNATEQAVHFAKNIDRVPAIIANKIVSGFNSFFK